MFDNICKWQSKLKQTIQCLHSWARIWVWLLTLLSFFTCIQSLKVWLLKPKAIKASSGFSNLSTLRSARSYATAASVALPLTPSEVTYIYEINTYKKSASEKDGDIFFRFSEPFSLFNLLHHIATYKGLSRNNISSILVFWDPPPF